MNERQKQIKRNDNLRSIDVFKTMSGESKRGVIRISNANTLEHEQKKLEICYNLKERGHHFLTEATFKTPFRGRCDVLDLDTGTVYEIVKSETSESILQKQRKYPNCFEIEVVKI